MAEVDAVDTAAQVEGAIGGEVEGPGGDVSGGAELEFGEHGVEGAGGHPGDQLGYGLGEATQAALGFPGYQRVLAVGGELGGGEEGFAQFQDALGGGIGWPIPPASAMGEGFLVELFEDGMQEGTGAGGVHLQFLAFGEAQLAAGEMAEGTFGEVLEGTDRGCEGAVGVQGEDGVGWEAAEGFALGGEELFAQAGGELGEVEEGMVGGEIGGDKAVPAGAFEEFGDGLGLVGMGMSGER